MEWVFISDENNKKENKKKNKKDNGFKQWWGQYCYLFSKHFWVFGPCFKALLTSHSWAT